ncbi:unnamed protein product, partial [Symbiodinium necroappetens]
ASVIASVPAVPALLHDHSKTTRHRRHTPRKGRIKGIPLVYAWFCGDTLVDEENKVAWNISGPCVVEDYFYRILAVSLLHVPTVVLLTDPSLLPTFEARLPAFARKGFRLDDYLQYADTKFLKLRSLYVKHLNMSAGTWAGGCCRGHKEPFEMFNVLNYYVVRAWMEEEDIKYVAYAEADVAVIVPPYLPRKCQSEIAWRFRWDASKEWLPFTYSALGSMGGVLSLDVLNDWTDFDIAMFEDYIWLRYAIQKNLFSGINQMSTWYFYAMGSLDTEGLPWSDGEPWFLQYVRFPPHFTRQELHVPPPGPDVRMLPDYLMPPTKRYRICNGYYPTQGHLIDSAHGWNARNYSCCHVRTAGGKVEVVHSESLNRSILRAVADNFTLRNLHFQGNSKPYISKLFAPLFRAYEGFNFSVKDQPPLALR